MKRPHAVREDLSKRERQAMDIVFAGERVTAAEVQARLPGNPSYSAARELMRRLAQKGLVSIEREGTRYVYVPSTSPDVAGAAALRRVITTFFRGSTPNMFSALLRASPQDISDEDLAALEDLIRLAREK